MITVPRTHRADNYLDYADYADAQAALDGRLDQQRYPVPARPVRPPVAYHAHYDGAYGTALRDAAGAVWFRYEDATVILLHDCDAPYLQLHGHVAEAQAQRVRDDLAGGLLHLCDVRNSEHARTA